MQVRHYVLDTFISERVSTERKRGGHFPGPQLARGNSRRRDAKTAAAKENDNQRCRADLK